MSIYGPRGADNLLGPLRSYVGGLMAWAKQRAAGYGMAAALIVVAILFIGIGAGVGTAALFHWIELKYGAWTAYSVIGGLFGVVGMSALLFALIMVKRRKPPLPVPPSFADVVRRAALPVASRFVPETGAGIAGRADGTTRLLAAAATLLLIGWAVASHGTHSSYPERSQE